jgi:chromosome partitioning protein
MKIITTSHQKGGVGKTSLTVNLALCYAQNLKVAVIDTDLQGSLSGISAMLSTIDIIPFDKYATNIKGLKNLDYDIIIIDTPPYLTDILTKLFEISDYVLVPSKVSYVDIMAVRATIEMINEVKHKHPELKAGLVLNMVKSNTSINDEIRELIKNLDIPLLESSVGDRVSFTRSLIIDGIFNTDDDKAKDEIVQLAREVLLAITQ